jgi:hypothetical protein
VGLLSAAGVLDWLMSPRIVSLWMVSLLLGWLWAFTCVFIVDASFLNDKLVDLDQMLMIQPISN